MNRKAKRVRFIGAVLATVMIGFIFLSAQNPAAQVSELRAFVSDGVKPAVEELTPQIERSIGRRVKTDFDSSKNLVDKIKAGETFDVVILTTATLDDVAKQGKIAVDSRVSLARCGVGVGIRTGVRKPDISTPEGMKRALLDAKFVTFNSTGAPAGLVNGLFEKLGIMDAMKSKLVTDSAAGGPQRKVAEGKADLVLTLIPEVTQEPGVDFLGPLPGNLQTYVNFEGAPVSARLRTTRKKPKRCSGLSPRPLPHRSSKPKGWSNTSKQQR